MAHRASMRSTHTTKKHVPQREYRRAVITGLPNWPQAASLV